MSILLPSRADLLLPSDEDVIRLSPQMRRLPDAAIERMMRKGEVTLMGRNLVPALAGGALANDSVVVAPDGSGALVATHTPSGSSKEYQAYIECDSEGNVMGSIPSYFMYQEPRVTTGAATDLWDLFVGGSATHSVRIIGLWPIITFSSAVAFTTPWRFDVIRTSAVGTGGTTASVDAAAPATGICSINKMDTSDTALATLDANITCRAVPTGGATAETLIVPISILPEETSQVTVYQQYTNVMPVTAEKEHVRLRPGKGIKVRQITATASTGALFGWLLQFAVI